MRLDPGEPEEEGVNLTPMIDMVFLLLIFFLAATTFAKEEEVQMALDLPKAASGARAERPRPIVVNIGRDGALTVDGRRVELESLRERLEAAAQGGREQEVVIRGDTQVHFGVVAKALDACRLARLNKVAIAARPEGEVRPR